MSTAASAPHELPGGYVCMWLCVCIREGGRLPILLLVTPTSIGAASSERLDKNKS